MMKIFDRQVFIRSAIQLIKTEIILKRIKTRYGKDVALIILRGATGDAYLQLAFLDEYIKQHNINKYILAGDVAGIKGVKKCFNISKYISYSHDIVDGIEKYWMMMWDKPIIDLHILFTWNYIRNNFNRCRIRMRDDFTFMDTYKYFALGLNGDVKLRKPQFLTCKDEDILRWIKYGARKGKTVILSPEANSVTRLPDWFWNGLIDELQKKGLTVLVNSDSENNYLCPDVFFTYYESVPFLDYCGYFIGIRSGLCDIICHSKCKKIIIYPKCKNPINYSEHRSEKEFSSMKYLYNLTNENLIEINTEEITNITDSCNITNSYEEYFDKYKYLITNVVSEIEFIND